MMKHEEMITLIGDLFMDAYMAGQQTDMSSIQRARADRDRLLHEVKEVYLELESESYNREQTQVELHKTLKELKAEKEMSARKEELLQKLLGPDEDEELPDHHDAFDAMFPGCTPDDLPFPDVEDLTPASELLGGEE